MISTDIYGFWSVCRCPMCPRSHGTHKIEMVRRIIEESSGRFSPKTALITECTWLNTCHLFARVRFFLSQPETHVLRRWPWELRRRLYCLFLPPWRWLLVPRRRSSISDMLYAYSMISISRGEGVENEKTVHFWTCFWEFGNTEKWKNLPLARSRNPENRPILDNLEGKPLGLFEESSWLREFNFREVFFPRGS